MLSEVGNITTPVQLMEKIKLLYSGLSPQFQAGAKYLMDHPDEVAISSMRTIATNARVQSSTLVRLAQHLGFQGWPEMKNLFVEQIRSNPLGYAKKAKSLTEKGTTEGTVSALVSEVFHAQSLNLQTTERANTSALLAAAQIIEKARQVHVAGFRASYPVAFSFQYLYRLFRPSVQLISGQAGTLEMSLRAIEENDVVLVTSFAPYSSEALVVADVARKAKSKLIALTDSVVSPIALQADSVIIVAVESPSFFPSIVAAVAAVESLVEILVSQGGAEMVKRIDAAEKQLAELGAYTYPD